MYKKALVTGGAGFIGSHLTELLVKKNFKVTVIDNLSNGSLSNLKSLIKKKKINFIKADLKNLKKNKKTFNQDYVFHLAALGSIIPSIDNPKKYVQNNFNGTVNLLECIRDYKIKKIVYAASSSCYGISTTPTSENNIIDPQNPYAFSKWVAEEAIKHWSKIYKIPFISIRIFNAYGSRFRTKGAYGSVIGVFLRQQYSKKPLTVVGSGKQSRDYVHVMDVAEAFYLAAVSRNKNNIFNLGYSKSISVNEIVKIINPKKTVRLQNRPGEPYKTLANTSKIRSILKWKPQVDFEKGLRELVDNISEWKSGPLWDKKSIRKVTKNWFKYLKK
jgi:UDP-glucose 4-epimerase